MTIQLTEGIYLHSPKRDKFISNYYSDVEKQKKFDQKKIDNIPMMSPEDKQALKADIIMRRTDFILPEIKERIDQGEVILIEVTAYRSPSGRFAKKGTSGATEFRYKYGYDNVARRAISVKRK